MLNMYQQTDRSYATEPTILHYQFEAAKLLSTLLMHELDHLAKLPAAVENSVENGTSLCLFTALERFECNLIRTALIRSLGNQKKAAKLLSLNPSTLNAKIKHFNIDLLSFRASV